MSETTTFRPVTAVEDRLARMRARAREITIRRARLAKEHAEAQAAAVAELTALRAEIAYLGIEAAA